MYPDRVWETLHPFHQWAQIAAVCAFLLASASFAVLALSRRFSRRWWLGQGIFALCLLAVVFGARSRGAAVDPLPVAVGCYAPHGSTSCDFVAVWIIPAQQRVEMLGAILLVVTVLVVIATLAALARQWPRSGPRRRLPPVLPPMRVLGLPLAITVAGYGTFQIANSVARWIATAYLADIRNAGDGIGQLPLIYAIAGTLFGATVLVIGLVLMVFCTPPHREHLQPG